MKMCSVSGCCSKSASQGGRFNARPDAITTKYCRKHLRWLTQYGSTDVPRHAQGPLEDRFWKFVTKTDSCWIWNGAKQKRGYGLIQDSPEMPNTHGKTRLAHRVSYAIHYGEVPDGMMVLHSCDNPSCVNPDHLRVGSGSENIKEAFDKGRKLNPIAFGEENPKSKLTLEQVRFIKAHPEMGHKQIADMFGLSPNCIRGVRTGRTWKHVE